MMDRNTIILSGVNLFHGGTLKIMQDCIDALVAYSGGRYRIVALVHDTDLYPDYSEVEYLAFPRSRRSWLFRLYYEYIYFKKISIKYKPYLWFSMHDATPRVDASLRAVYCQHAAPFYQGKRGLREFWMEPSFVIFSLFYKWFYQINLQKNNYIIVQQQWLREEFVKMVQYPNRIVLAPPENIKGDKTLNRFYYSKEEKNIIFFYPSVPRVFKNFEVICQAARVLSSMGITGFKIRLTVKGDENRYARWLCHRYKDIKTIDFIGFLTREQMEETYQRCDCVIFPSRLESWGLPVSEAKEHNKPILIADLPYARETVGGYDRACFFDPENPKELASVMKEFITKKIQYDQTQEVKYLAPYALNWRELFNILLKEK